MILICKKVTSKPYKLCKLYFNTILFVYKCIFVDHYNKLLLLLLLLLLLFLLLLLLLLNFQSAVSQD